MDFDTIIKKLRTALYGVEVREYIAKAMEWVKSCMESSVETITGLLDEVQAAKDAASTSASNAASSASAASTSASNAASSASAAKRSQTDAASSASAAKTSETHAKASADNAANAATNAVKQAKDAGTFDGQSAYALAVQLGYTGSEAAWIASLKGDKGDTGPAGSYPNATQSTAGLMSAADKMKLDDLSNAITASGSNYVRFSDGTQICWSDTYTTMKETVGESTYTGYGFGFSVPFSSTSYSAVISETESLATSGMLSSHWPKATTYVTFNDAWHSAIAIGRWK